MQQHTEQKPELKLQNQKHFIVVSILIVLLTLYLTASVIIRVFESNSSMLTEEIRHIQKIECRNEELPKKQLREQEDNQRRTIILERLREHKDICYDIQIFTPEIEIEIDRNKDYVNVNRNEKVIQMEDDDDTTVLKRNNNNQQYRRNRKKSLKSRVTNTKNRDRDTATTLSTKDQNQNQAKKNSTSSEPIIYMFALVFIYLLLKAASDISQHYKMQSKGDKRLRRCSLQSYAQTHKPERRSSKASPSKSRLLTMDSRSKSVDQYTLHETSTQKTHVLSKLRSYTSVDEGFCLTYRSNRDTGRNAMGMLENRHSNESLPPKTRRCSMPTAKNYQRIMIGTSRRTSMVGDCRSLIEEDLQISEVKRRVRMINRH